MRKDLTIYSLAIILGFVMGLFTCKTCTDPAPAAPPVKVDTVKTVVHDSIKVPVPTPVRITVPTLATEKGRVETRVLRIPYPVYIPVQGDSCRHLYDQLYEDYATRRDYDNSYPFGSDTVRIKQTIQGNDLWEQQVYLTHVDKVLVPSQKKRNSVWWGASGYYRSGEIGVGSSLMFQHKKGYAVEAGASIGTQGIPTYSGGVKWKIGRK